MKRRVLFIAYNFPPAGGAGVQRSLKFAKYLPEFGWQPVVITTTPDAFPLHDKSMLADVPVGTPIYRIKSYDINRLLPLFSRIKLSKLHSALKLLLMLPDAALLWARLARSTVRQAVKHHKPCLIYSSSAPESAHLLGMWAKHVFKLPWIADFRDPWSENRLVRYFPGYRALNRHLECQALANADCVLTVSAPLSEDFRRIGGVGELPVKVIENGYDEDDVNALPPKRSRCFTITYTGNFTRLRRPDAFIAAINRLVDGAQVNLDQICVVMAGKNIFKYVPDRPPFRQPGYLNHNRLKDLFSDSDLFLLIQDDSPKNQGAYSGKLFEYLGSNRPILAITHPDSVAAQLIEQARAGTVTRHNSSEIVAAILHYYRIWESERFDYAPDWDVIQQYTRRNLTARLAGEFDRLAGFQGIV